MTTPPRAAAHRGTRPGRDVPAATRFAEPRVRRWTPGSLFPVTLRDTGVLFGVTGGGGRLTHPLLQPGGPTRVGIVGLPRLTEVLALRLLGASCALTVLTSEQERWRTLLGRVSGASVEIVSQVTRWPPSGSTAPWALIADSGQAPPPGFGRSAWSTVVHSPPTLPQGSAWWQSAQYVVTGRPQLPAVLNMRPRVPQELVARMQEDELLSVEASTATLFRPSLTEDEDRILRGV